MPQYRGLEVVVPENDQPHREYLAQQSSGRLTLQKRDGRGLFCYPSGPICPDCNSASLSWVPYPLVGVDAGGNPELEENLAIGKRVEVTMADLGDGWALPLFRLSDENPERKPRQFAAGS